RPTPADGPVGKERPPNRFAANLLIAWKPCPRQPAARGRKHRDSPRVLSPPRLALPVSSSRIILGAHPKTGTGSESSRRLSAIWDGHLGAIPVPIDRIVTLSHVVLTTVHRLRRAARENVSCPGPTGMNIPPTFQRLCHE